ncbi:hypothetical protein [Echinicola shivajiensis]|uniref:hypothetical protein n=1 Tax=Echinicola shivajiensis TaxID=1035916 RepID=UPI001BFC4AC3|nr:hypothetical protein [Echinicola shivajiensis]
MKKENEFNKLSASNIKDEAERNWEKLYDDVHLFMSDIEFLADEFNFFKILINKYFIWLNAPKFISKNRYYVETLSTLEKRQLSLSKRLKKHMSDISEQIKSNKEKPSQEIIEDHLELKIMEKELVKEVRLLKKDIFKLTEKSLMDMKGDHLLG